MHSLPFVLREERTYGVGKFEGGLGLKMSNCLSIVFFYDYMVHIHDSAQNSILLFSKQT